MWWLLLLCIKVHWKESQKNFYFSKVGALKIQNLFCMRQRPSRYIIYKQICKWRWPLYFCMVMVAYVFGLQMILTNDWVSRYSSAWNLSCLKFSLAKNIPNEMPRCYTKGYTRNCRGSTFYNFLFLFDSKWAYWPIKDYQALHLKKSGFILNS